MTKTFCMFENRKDRSLTGFSAEDNAVLLGAICTNSATGYVTQATKGGPVSVPNRHAEAVAAHLERLGWVRA